MDGGHSTAWGWVGAVLLMLQPLVIVSQLVVASRWVGDFEPTRNTISDLGAVSCTTIQAAYGPVEVCSPWHALMNGTFVVLGVALALGGALVLGVLGTDGLRLAGAGLLAVAGVSSLLVGLVPLDRDPGLHTLVATPLFAAQPLALLLLAAALWHARRSLAVGLGVAGVVAAVGALAFGATLVAGVPGGFYERLGLWPCHLGLALLGGALLRRPVPQVVEPGEGRARVETPDDGRP